jgi:hypothetical protein
LLVEYCPKKIPADGPVGNMSILFPMIDTPDAVRDGAKAKYTPLEQLK